MIIQVNSGPPPPLPTTRAKTDPIRTLVKKAARAIQPGQWFVCPLEHDELERIAIAESQRAAKAHRADWMFQYRLVCDRLNQRLRYWRTDAIATLSQETPPRIIVTHRSDRLGDPK